MMEYKEFKQKLQNDLSRKMPEMIFLSHKVESVQRKPYDGISVIPSGNRVGIVLNTEGMYSQMKNDDDYRRILSEAEGIVKENRGRVTDRDIEFLPDYVKVRENLAVELVDRERNSEKLAEIPHRDMGDMSLVYRVLIGRFEDKEASTLINNGMLKAYGITQEQLHQDALKNATEKQPFKIVRMDSFLKGYTTNPEEEYDMAPDGPPMFYIATNQSMINGAAVIAYPEFMEEAARQLQGDFFILPSSIHEVLLLKDDGKQDYRDLENIVSSVNADVVSPEEQLSGKVYHYDSVEKVFESAEKFESRKQEREKQPRSVLEELKNLKEKAEQHKPKPQTRPAPAFGASL